LTETIDNAIALPLDAGIFYPEDETMKASGGVLTFALAAACLVGCVDRRYVITTDPPGAVVYRNDHYLGATPVDDHFIYYGKYHFTIVKEGYETLQVEQDISTPWYQYPGIDFIAEALVPYQVIDRREFHYKLEPRKLPDQNQFLQQAAALREKGLALGPGKPGSAAAPVPPGVPVGPDPLMGPGSNTAPPPGSPYIPISPPPGAVVTPAPVVGSAVTPPVSAPASLGNAGTVNGPAPANQGNPQR
jgi:hypothetical protein